MKTFFGACFSAHPYGYRIQEIEAESKDQAMALLKEIYGQNNVEGASLSHALAVKWVASGNAYLRADNAAAAQFEETAYGS
jgi:hypothetical protein